MKKKTMKLIERKEDEPHFGQEGPRVSLVWCDQIFHTTTHTHTRTLTVSFSPQQLHCYTSASCQSRVRASNPTHALWMSKGGSRDAR